MAKIGEYLIDTDVIIEYMRSKTEAVVFFDANSSKFVLSVITIAELYAGVRQGTEKNTLSEFLSTIQVLPLFKEIAIEGGQNLLKYSKSHGTGLGDALIRATAEYYGLILVTRNKKHFPMFENVLVPY